MADERGGRGSRRERRLVALCSLLGSGCAALLVLVVLAWNGKGPFGAARAWRPGATGAIGATGPFERAGEFVIYTPVPDPDVDLTFLPGLVEHAAFRTEARLSTNSCGLRFPREFDAKTADVYRVILLGDSFVAAHAAPFEDGAGPQLEGMLARARRAEAAGGRRIEVLPVAVGGWNVFAQVSYLLHNLESFAPDLVVHVINSNDVDSGSGFVLGNMRSQVYDLQARFGPSHLSISSPFYVDLDARYFGLVASYLIPESKRRYEAAAREVGRLRTRLAADHGARYVLCCLSLPMALPLRECFASELPADDVFFSPGEVAENNLAPLDGHPDREGYRFLALCMAHFLSDRGILPCDPERLRAEGPYAAYEALHEVEVDEAFVRGWFQVERIPDGFDVEDGRFVPEDGLRCVVGGLFPTGILSPRCLLALRRGTDHSSLRLRLRFPRRSALVGRTMTVRLDGVPATTIAMDARPGDAIEVRLPLPASLHDLVEVSLESDGFYTDPRQVVEAGVFRASTMCGELLSARLLFP